MVVWQDAGLPNGPTLTSLDAYPIILPCQNKTSTGCSQEFLYCTTEPTRALLVYFVSVVYLQRSPYKRALESTSSVQASVAVTKIEQGSLARDCGLLPRSW